MPLSRIPNNRSDRHISPPPPGEWDPNGILLKVNLINNILRGRALLGVLMRPLKIPSLVPILNLDGAPNRRIFHHSCHSGSLLTILSCHSGLRLVFSGYLSSCDFWGSLRAVSEVGQVAQFLGEGGARAVLLVRWHSAIAGRGGLVEDCFATCCHCSRGFVLGQVALGLRSTGFLVRGKLAVVRFLLWETGVTATVPFLILHVCNLNVIPEVDITMATCIVWSEMIILLVYSRSITLSCGLESRAWWFSLRFN